MTRFVRYLAHLLILLIVGCAEEAPAPPDAEDTAAPAASGPVDLRRIGYSRGATDAPITVYEFSDFGCPYCAQFALETYPPLHREFVESGRVRWIYVPFAMGMFPNGDQAALASECGAEQDLFWEMHDELFRAQRAWKSSSRPAETFANVAADAGLDVDVFDACFSDGELAARTAQNNRAAAMLRVRATPTFFINGRMVEGALPLQQFREVLAILGAAPR